MEQLQYVRNDDDDDHFGMPKTVYLLNMETDDPNTSVAANAWWLVPYLVVPSFGLFDLETHLASPSLS
jgi:hypothetical protein